MDQKKQQQPKQDPNWGPENQTAFPCAFFPDKFKNKWFRVESQVNDFGGIMGCLVACQEAIQNQKIDGQGEFSNYWDDLQNTIKYAQETWKKMDAYQKEHNPSYKGTEFNFPPGGDGDDDEWKEENYNKD